MSTNSTTWANICNFMQEQWSLYERKQNFSTIYNNTLSEFYLPWVQNSKLMLVIWWAERDSNPRRRSQGIYSPPHLTALESAPKKISPELSVLRDPKDFLDEIFSVFMEPLVGLEPTTIRLQGECSTNWAKVAYLI